MAAIILHTVPAMPLTPCWPPPVITSISCLDGCSSCCLDSWRLKTQRPPFNGSENRKLHGRLQELRQSHEILGRGGEGEAGNSKSISIASIKDAQDSEENLRGWRRSARLRQSLLSFPPIIVLESHDNFIIKRPQSTKHTAATHFLKEFCRNEVRPLIPLVSGFRPGFPFGNGRPRAMDGVTLVLAWSGLRMDKFSSMPRRAQRTPSLRAPQLMPPQRLPAVNWLANADTAKKRSSIMVAYYR